VILRRPAQYLEGRLRGSAVLAVAIFALAAVLCALSFLWRPFALIGLALLGVSWFVFLRKGRGPDPQSLAKGGTGELSIAATLAPLQHEGHHLLHEVRTGAGAIEHVLIGPRGSFAIETKHWEGTVSSKAGRLWHDRKEANDPVLQCMRSAMEIRRRLKVAGIEVPVDAVVVTTRAKVLRSPLTFNNVTVLEKQKLLGFIRSREAGMSEADVARARTAILRGDDPATVHRTGQT
jgi:hypothetical protein